jgi:hypothetical protein
MTDVHSIDISHQAHSESTSPVTDGPASGPTTPTKEGL